jgi:1,4-dihydroxy-2-naphthoyl-CoA hydrolase
MIVPACHRQQMRSAEQFMERQIGSLPDHLGIIVLEASPERMVLALAVTPRHHAPNGFLHAGSVVALADTACGYGTVLNLPEGADGFTTIELKSNFFSTAMSGRILATAKPVHRGRTTQVWDAEVVSEGSQKRLALFRCTQSVLWPRG